MSGASPPAPGRSRRAAFAVVAATLSVLVTLLGLEGAFRVYWAASIDGRSPTSRRFASGW